RVVLSGNFTQPAVRQIFRERGLGNIGGGRFFTNAIDTETRGFDLVASYGLSLGRAGLLRATTGYNQNRTKVTRIASTPPELAAFQATLFDRTEEGRIEDGQPRNNLNVTLNLTAGNLALNLHNQRFGEVTAHNLKPELDQTFSPKWVTDLDVSYHLMQRLRVAVGANNLLDVYPDEWKDFSAGVNGALTTSGIYRYAGGVSPMGFNGRFVYLRLSYQ
ncbi:MAG: TonB-dependent receptor, partial [Gemmatimonadetes bacterium]|nr:TonB-dependent receptor [Gemmatimonadota bacterium]